MAFNWDYNLTSLEGFELPSFMPPPDQSTATYNNAPVTQDQLNLYGILADQRASFVPEYGPLFQVGDGYGNNRDPGGVLVKDPYRNMWDADGDAIKSRQDAFFDFLGGWGLGGNSATDRVDPVTGENLVGIWSESQAFEELPDNWLDQLINDTFQKTVNPDIFITGNPTPTADPAPAADPNQTDQNGQDGAPDPNQTGGGQADPVPDVNAGVQDPFPDGDFKPSRGDSNNNDWWRDVPQIFDIFRRGNPVSQSPDNLPDWLKKTFSISDMMSGGQGGSATATGGNASVTGGNSSNIFSDMFGGMFGDIGKTVIDAGFSNYAADKQLEGINNATNLQRDIYNADVARLQPYNQLGRDNMSAAQAAINKQPSMRDLFSGQYNVNPNTNVSYNMSGLPSMQAGGRGMFGNDPSGGR